MKNSLNDLTEFLENATHSLIARKEVKSSILIEKIFSGSLLSQNTYSHVTFTGCVFYGSELKDCSFEACKFIDCEFKFSDMNYCTFTGCEFSGCQWIGNHYQGSEFKMCSMDEATLTECSTDGVEVTHCFCSPDVLETVVVKALNHDDWLKELDPAVMNHLDDLVREAELDHELAKA